MTGRRAHRPTDVACTRWNVTRVSGLKGLDHEMMRFTRTCLSKQERRKLRVALDGIQFPVTPDVRRARRESAPCGGIRRVHCCSSCRTSATTQMLERGSVVPRATWATQTAPPSRSPRNNCADSLACELPSYVAVMAEVRMFRVGTVGLAWSRSVRTSALAT